MMVVGGMLDFYSDRLSLEPSDLVSS